MKRIIEVQRERRRDHRGSDLTKMIDTQFLPEDIRKPK
jgi:hypothetical protein